LGALCPKTWALKLIDRSFDELLDTDHTLCKNRGGTT
jgi:hypothetical protein